jgi:hypothetical protein
MSEQEMASLLREHKERQVAADLRAALKAVQETDLRDLKPRKAKKPRKHRK